MNVTDPYKKELKEIVNEYVRIEKMAASLLEQTNLLNLKKQQIEFDLATAREKERTLIDKIKSETGEDPNLFEILQNINQL